MILPAVRPLRTIGEAVKNGRPVVSSIKADALATELNKARPVYFDTRVGVSDKTIAISPKQTRVVSEGTYPLYTGPKHSVTEVVNPDGTVNPRAALRIEREVADNIPGAHRMEFRLENPE